jgi:SAM-dependent methyltransferase
MEREQQQRYYELGNTYWWLAGKYRIVRDVLERHLTPTRGREALLLDLGCGPGNLLDLLAPYGKSYGSDFSQDALRFCFERAHTRLFRADFQALPLPGESFDVVTCVDVLEHLADDARALRELHRVLRPSGLLVLTVPAFQVLWGDHDELYGHHRRYRARELRARLERAGLSVLKLTYLEPLFFVPLWIYRRWKRLLPRSGGLAKRDDFVDLPAALNRLLGAVIAAERFGIRHLDFPFGVTLLAVARKAPDPARP